MRKFGDEEFYFEVFRAALAITLGVLTAGAAAAEPKLTVLHSFCSDDRCSDGTIPVGGVIADSNGYLYGTTSLGGESGSGVVFQLSSSGTEYKVLYSFCSRDLCFDGGSPLPGLVADPAGLSGMTSGGGANGHGVVFRLGHQPNPREARVYSVLHSFTLEGGLPERLLRVDSGHNLYGSTQIGVFQLLGNGNYSELHSYSVSDGYASAGGLIADSKGNLYGTLSGGGGGSGCLGDGCGVVFQLSLPAIFGEAWTYSKLHTFNGGSDGADPRGGLITDSNGNLYGTTRDGGTSVAGAAGPGVVFQLSPPATPGAAWPETILYSFDCLKADCGAGASPKGPLIADGAGNLYGTASAGGASRKGVVFKLSPDGSYSVLYTFCGMPSCSDGDSPDRD